MITARTLSALAVLTAALPALADDGYSPGGSSQPALSINGYVDVGLAAAQGDGTSFPANDTRQPADYGVDTFAPAVNSRGDVASTDPHGRFVNGFLPRSMGINGQPSFFISTVNLDLRYQVPAAPVMFFTRVQLLPRYGAGNETRLYVEQAFARIIPFQSQEIALSVGKFDSVFGIEYLENEANLRTGITPSLIARYTTGQSLGLKAFARRQIPALWAAVSLNLAVTNGGTLVETLSPPDLSLSGRPLFSGRAGFEVNLPSLEVKLGASGMTGPRNDQRSPGVRQHALGADARLVYGHLSLGGEFVWIHQDGGGADKQNGLGAEVVASDFFARGAYGFAAFALPLSDSGAFRRLTPYVRLERRHARFEGFRPYTVQRTTAGARLDLWDQVALKAEVLLNRELEGAPDVDNDVVTSSLVFAW